MLSTPVMNHSTEFSMFNESNQRIVARFDLLKQNDLHYPLTADDFNFYQTNAAQYCKIVGAEQAGKTIFSALDHRFTNIAIALIQAGADINATVPSCPNSLLKSAEINEFTDVVAAIKAKSSTQSEDILKEMKEAVGLRATI